MAASPYSRDTYTSAGEATYTITWPYLAAGHINLFVDGVSKTYTLDDTTTLRPDTAVTSGQIVLITRTSNQAARLVDYVDASVFKAATLDDDLLQAFYISQEALDESTLVLGLNAAGDEWDGEGNKLGNIILNAAAGYAVEYDQMIAYVASVGGVPANTVAGRLLSSSATIPEWAGDRQAYSVQWDDAGATVGPVLALKRSNAAGAAADSDIMGALSFEGEDDAGTPAVVDYARIHAKAIDVSAADEEGELSFQVMSAGTLTETAKVTLDGLTMDAAVITGTITQGGAAVNDDVTQDAAAKTALLAADSSWSGAQRGTFVDISQEIVIAAYSTWTMSNDASPGFASTGETFVAVNSSADTATLTLAAALSAVEYNTIFEVSAWTDDAVTLKIGGVDGTARSSAAVFEEAITAGATDQVVFTTGTSSDLTLGTTKLVLQPSTLLVDFNDGNNFYATLRGDATIGQPSNQVIGQCGYIIIEQDATGGRTPSWHADWDFGVAGAPSVDGTAAKKAVIAYVVDWDTTVVTKFIGDF